MLPLTERFDRAFELAHLVHRTQTRKGGPVPYIGHLMAVTSITLDYGGDEDQAIAALLHDSLEDTKEIPPAQLRVMIQGAFGAAVLRIIEDCTDTDERPKPAWRVRKERYVQHTREEAPPPSLLVSAADKLHNVLSILRDVRHEGDAAFARFNKDAGKQGTLWYYRALADVFTARLDGRLGGRLASDLDAAVRQLEGAAAEKR